MGDSASKSMKKLTEKIKNLLPTPKKYKYVVIVIFKDYSCVVIQDDKDGSVLEVFKTRPEYVKHWEAMIEV